MQPDLCQTCLETTLLVFPQVGSYQSLLTSGFPSFSYTSTTCSGEYLASNLAISFWNSSSFAPRTSPSMNEIIIITSRKHFHVIYTTLNPTFIQQNWGLRGIPIFFLFLLQNIYCGYSLEAVLTCTYNLC